MEIKQCARCKESKSLLCFGVQRAEKDGLNRYCRDCLRKLPGTVAASNRDKLKRVLKKQSLTGAERWDGGGA